MNNFEYIKIKKSLLENFKIKDIKKIDYITAEDFQEALNINNIV